MSSFRDLYLPTVQQAAEKNGLACSAYDVEGMSSMLVATVCFFNSGRRHEQADHL